MPSAPGPLRITLDAPATVKRRARVRMTLRAENVGDRSLDLELRGRAPAVDASIETVDGTVLWNSTYAQLVPAILLLATVHVGESLVLPIEWNQRDRLGQQVPPGNYLIRAGLLTDGPALAAPPHSLTILP